MPVREVSVSAQWALHEIADKAVDGACRRGSTGEDERYQRYDARVKRRLAVRFVRGGWWMGVPFGRVDIDVFLSEFVH